MPDNHKAILEKANAAAREGDAEGFLKHCTEDTEWTFVGDQVLKGKSAVREWMREAYKTPPKFDVQRMVVEGDFLTAIGEIMVRNDDGTEVPSAYCDVWRFKDGLLAQLYAFVVEGQLERDALK
jgi:uncharacterized protein